LKFYEKNPHKKRSSHCEPCCKILKLSVSPVFDRLVNPFSYLIDQFSSHCSSSNFYHFDFRRTKKNSLHLKALETKKNHQTGKIYATKNQPPKEEPHSENSKTFFHPLSPFHIQNKRKSAKDC
jgi:transposase